MTTFWKRWLDAWCAAVLLFGGWLALSGVQGLDGPAAALLHAMGGEPLAALDRTTRFAVGLMGCVTVGWGLCLWVAFRAARALGPAGASAWRGLTAGALVWFVIDSLLSIHTGFALNAVSNLAFTVAFLIPVLASGVLRGEAQAGPTRNTANLFPSGSRK